MVEEQSVSGCREVLQMQAMGTVQQLLAFGRIAIYRIASSPAVAAAACRSIEITKWLAASYLLPMAIPYHAVL
jgi:ABC-type taurine transport system substrate-binding protein